VKLILRAFRFNTVIYSLAYLTTNISYQGLTIFMPTVIANLGKFTVVESQLRTVPPYLVGIVWSLCLTAASHKTKQRGIYIMACALCGVAGYSINLATQDPHARYAACFLTVMAGVAAFPILLAWGAESAAPDTVRAVTTALVPEIGSVGSIIAMWTYLPDDGPSFHNGNSLNIAACTITFLLVLTVRQYNQWENKQRETGRRDWRVIGARVVGDGNSTRSEVHLDEKDVRELGSAHPEFRFRL
jgi:hypothetical protein